MAASADVRTEEAIREARRAERSPAGWRTIAAKELTDHVSSVRFIVLLVIIGLAAAAPLWFLSNTVKRVAEQATGTPALLLALFTEPATDAGNIVTVALVAFLTPLIGIAFGFDAVNSERSQGTLSRLLAQPIHRDDVINGKFAAGLGVIALILGILAVLVTGFSMIRLGIVPSIDEILRILLWLVVTVLYAGVWLAFALFLSVVLRSAASAALVGFGTWLGLTLFGSLVLPLVANALFPLNVSSEDAFTSSATAQGLFLRLSPVQVYQDIVAVVMSPRTPFAFIGSAGQIDSIRFLRPDTLLSVDESLLIVWPQIVVLVAVTVGLFALAYVTFMRQEVRA